MAQPAKDASPDEAATGLWVQDSWAAPVPVPEVMLRVTAAVLVETRLSKASTTAKLPGSAKFVRILPHPDGLHAVIVRVPGGMDARKYIAELRDAPDDPNMRMDANVLSFESRLLWPSVGTQEFVDLVDLFALAHRMVYPSELQKLAGFTGIDVKKKG